MCLTYWILTNIGSLYALGAIILFIAVNLRCACRPDVSFKAQDHFVFAESSDEGITADYEDFKYEDIKREVIDLRQKLEQEKQLRMILELRAHTLNTHQYAEKVQNGGVQVDPQPKPPAPTVEKVMWWYMSADIVLLSC